MQLRSLAARAISAAVNGTGGKVLFVHFPKIEIEVLSTMHHLGKNNRTPTIIDKTRKEEPSKNMQVRLNNQGATKHTVSQRWSPMPRSRFEVRTPKHRRSMQEDEVSLIHPVTPKCSPQEYPYVHLIHLLSFIQETIPPGGSIIPIDLGLRYLSQPVRNRSWMANQCEPLWQIDDVRIVPLESSRVDDHKETREIQRRESLGRTRIP